MTATIESVIEAIGSFDLPHLRYELENLRAIKAWAMTKIGVNYPLRSFS